MEQNFMWLFQTRKCGWPDETDIQSLVKAKEKFCKKLLISTNTSHFHVYNVSETDRWENFNTVWQVTGFLRDIQLRFSLSSASSNIQVTPNNSGPQNQSHTANDDDMEVDALNKQKKNSGKKKSKSPMKSCIDCGGAFEKRRHWWTRCRDCQSKQPKRKMNNLEADSEEEAAEQQEAPELNDVSILTINSGCKYYEIGTSFQFGFDTVCQKIERAMYDNGANVTALDIDTFRKLENQFSVPIELNSSKKGSTVKQGDGSDMEGLLGTASLVLTLSDSMGYAVKPFKQEFLVFKKLNHPVIIGRNAMQKYAFKVIEYPQTSSMLINPSYRRIKKADQLFQISQDTVCHDSDNICQISSPISTDSKSENKIDSENLGVAKVSVPKNIYDRSFEDWKKDIEHIHTFEDRCIFEPKNKPEYGLMVLDCIDEDEDSASVNSSFKNLESDTVCLETRQGKVRVGKDLPKSLQSEVKQFFDSYKGSLFDLDSVGRTPNHSVKIKLKKGLSSEDIPPVRYIPLGPGFKITMSKMINEMVKKRVLRKTTKKANCCIFLVEKSSGGHRLICDLKMLNKVVEDFITHLQPIEEVLQELSQHSVFSYCDYGDAFFSIGCNSKESDIDIVASVAGSVDNYEFLAMPQGLKTASSVFISTMQDIFKEYLDWIKFYVDDGAIVSNTYDEMWTRMKLFFARSEENNLRIRLEKCAFFMKSINFLNFNVSKNKIGLSVEHQKAIKNLKLPDSLDQKARDSLAGFFNYFCRFVPMAKVCHILRNGSRTDCEKVLESVKTKLLDHNSLATVDFKQTLHIYVDASDSQAACMIFQGDSKKSLKLVTV